MVVGGSRGIGAATAKMAAAAGAAVSLTYRTDSTSATATERMITAAGGRAFAVPVDASHDGAVAEAIKDAVGKLGPLSGLVVSAGIFEPGSIADMTVAFWDRVMAVNLRGTFLSVQAAAAQLQSTGGGSIVIITSTAGQRGSPGYAAYASSKGAQILLMRSAAMELAQARIRVNCVAPAWTETDMTAPTMDAIGREAILQGCPLGRIGLPEDAAGATCFLLSDLAGYITGSTLTVDGGQDLRG